MRNKNIRELLLYTAAIYIMVMSMNLAVMDSTGLEISFLKIAVYALVSVIAAAAIIAYPVVLLPVFMGGAAGSVYIYFSKPGLIENFTARTVEFFKWLYGYTVGYNYFESKYSLVFAIFYIILITFPVSLAVYSGRGSFALIVIGTAALTFFWFIYVERARLYLMLFLFAAVTLYSRQIFKKRLQEWKQSGSIISPNVSRNWFISSVLTVTISIFPALMLPLNISALRWSWLNNKVVSMFPFVMEWRNDASDAFGYGFNSRYDLNLAGYKGRKLGGELMQDASVMLTVRTESKEILYLRGAVKEKYTGFTWSKRKRSYREYSSGQPMGIPYSDGIPTYESTMDISHEKLLTSTFFAPFSVYEVWHGSNRIFVDDSFEAYSSRIIARDEGYTVKSLIPYVDINRVRKSGADDIGSLERQACLELPGNMPDRVKALAQDITKDCGNNFDKAKTIEKYLRSNYKYTLKPPKLPDKREFTDYFLFEGKEGYCTYYATSMAVLLRAAGIPSRYVEGFISRYEGSKERKVRGTDAHAWAEAYFDGYGWLTFEATPAYPAVEFRSHAVSEEVQDTEAISNPISINFSGLSRRRGHLDIEDEGYNAPSGNYKKQEWEYLSMVIYVLLIMLALRIAYLFLKRMMKEFKLEHYRGKEYAHAYIRDILWYLRKAGLILKPEETLREYMGRVRFNYKERFSNIVYIIDIMEKIRYGEAELTAEERKALEEFRKGAKRLAIKKCGFINFYTSLYIVGR